MAAVMKPLNTGTLLQHVSDNTDLLSKLKESHPQFLLWEDYLAT